MSLSTTWGSWTYGRIGEDSGGSLIRVIGEYTLFSTLETQLKAASIGDLAVLIGRSNLVIGVFMKISTGPDTIQLIDCLDLTAINPSSPAFTITLAGGGGDFELEYGALIDVTWGTGADAANPYGLKLHNRGHLVLTALGVWTGAQQYSINAEAKLRETTTAAANGYWGVGLTFSARAASLVGIARANGAGVWYRSWATGAINAQLGGMPGIAGSRVAGPGNAAYIDWTAGLEYRVTTAAGNIHGTGGATQAISTGQFYEPLPTAAGQPIASAADQELVLVLDDPGGAPNIDVVFKGVAPCLAYL